MRIGIVGCGLIGGKRAKALKPGVDRLTAVADKDGARTQRLAGEHNCAVEHDWQGLVARDDVDAVVVATTNDMLAPVTAGALRHGKHVLVEKPAARNAAEVEPVAA